MRWIEIIQLRATQESKLNALIDELYQSLKDEAIDITFYRHAVVSTDLSIHLVYETTDDSAPDRTLSHRLAATLDEHGMVNRSLWRETSALDTVRRQS